MLLLNVTYQLKEHNAHDFLAAIEGSELLATIRNETGCIQYEYFVSLENPEKVLLTEKWSDKDALAAHAAAPHMANLRNVIARYCSDSDIMRAEVID